VKFLSVYCICASDMSKKISQKLNNAIASQLNRYPCIPSGIFKHTNKKQRNTRKAFIALDSCFNKERMLIVMKIIPKIRLALFKVESAISHIF
jgi:hypothetical protein